MFAALNSFLTRLGRITDPYWANVSMLLHGDGVNGGQNNTFLDGSTNNFTVTRNGNTTQGSFNPFVSTYPYSVATNGGSGYFDGTGDYLTVPDNAAFNLAANDFTIECWIYPTTNGATSYFFGQVDSGFAAPSFIIFRNVNQTIRVQVYVATIGVSATSVSLCPANAWYHIAFVRNGATIRLYINGVQDGSTAIVGSVDNSAGSVALGQWGDYSSSLYAGYISNARIVNGTCLYPSGTTFTPPTAPLTAVTNTALLLGMSNGAIFDNAILNNLETVASAQISTSTFKYGTGALKFDGTGDYLPTPPKTAFVLGSADFTIECWLYNISGNPYFAGQTNAAVSSTSFFMLVSGGDLYSAIRGTDAANKTCISSGAPITNTTWHHIAFVRDGNTLRQYINGVQNGTFNVTGITANTSTGQLAVGAWGEYSVDRLNGYIDDFRFTKGICRYPSGTTFTPPTAAFPNSGP